MIQAYADVLRRSPANTDAAYNYEFASRLRDYLAKVAATVDIISGGRTEMGIGAGWYEHEWRAYGYGFPSAGERLARLDEGATQASLPAMSSYERKLIHDIVADRGLVSESYGEGADRHTVIRRA